MRRNQSKVDLELPDPENTERKPAMTAHRVTKRSLTLRLEARG
jgi:hypothetical protein